MCRNRLVAGIELRVPTSEGEDQTLTRVEDGACTISLVLPDRDVPIPVLYDRLER